MPLQIISVIMGGFHSDHGEPTEHHTQGEFFSKQGDYLLHLNLLPACGSLMCMFNQCRLKVGNIWNNITVDLNLLQRKTPALFLFIYVGAPFWGSKAEEITK